MDNNLYEKLHKDNKMLADANKHLVLENRKLKRAFKALLSQVSDVTYEWSQLEAEIGALDKMLEKYRKLNLEVDDSIDDNE